jgi:alkylation response protein AidB-like acyl-CoA dehydrogenase
MSRYTAPIADMLFALRELAGYESVAALPGFEDASLDVVEAVLDEAATFAADVLDPLNTVGDRVGAVWSDGRVTMPAGFKEAYTQFGKAGWVGLPMPPEFGGQGLPQSVATAALEMWNAANMGFALGPLLNQGAIEALLLCGSDELKKTYVEKLVSGEWTGTMVLTEPNAGSDLAAVRTRAVPEGDHYRITGNKIYITYGEHDMSPNIVHLVLARTPNAPEGVKGISLFVVPKFLVNADGSLGERNDVYCPSIEHKLGIHASPTAVLNYGENGGAIGYLVGEECSGLAYMFVMMNLARFSVGVQGIGVSDRAFQHALEYARERVQSKDVGVKDPAPVAIVNHPDVRRMLMTMKAQVEAMRALALVTAAAMDHAHANADAETQAKHAALVEFFTPIVKGYGTEMSNEITSLGVQIHGGMGYVEETGAAIYFRDARITTIYEGTTAIQSNDFVGRKILRDKGAVAFAVIAEMRATAEALAASGDADLAAIRNAFVPAIEAIDQATRAVLATAGGGDLRTTFAGSVPLLMAWGVVAGGWQMARAALVAAAKRDADAFYVAKIGTARFYAEHLLPRATAFAAEVTIGAGSVMLVDDRGLSLDRARLTFA